MLGVVLLLPLTLGITGYVYRDRVQKLVVESLNERLNAKISVGSITFSLITSFPYAELTFHEVNIEEPAGFLTTGSVLRAEKVSLKLSLFSLFNQSYQLKKILIENATVNLQTDRTGRVNYRIWKETKNESALGIELEDVEFRNVNVLYYDTQKNHDITFLIEQGNLAGKFGDRIFFLETNANLKQTSVILDGVHYLSKKDAQLALGLEVNREEERYLFKKSSVTLAGMTLELEGAINGSEEEMMTDLTVSSPNAGLPELLSLIPDRYLPDTKGYSYDGKMVFKGTVKGKSGKKQVPRVAFEFALSNVSLSPQGSPYELTRVNGIGFFTNRKSDTRPVTWLRLENFSALLDGKPVKADISIEDFNHPMLDIQASAEVSLEALSRFFLPEPLTSIAGTLMVDASFKGIAGEKGTYRSSGNIGLKEVAFTLKDQPVSFHSFNGMIHLDGNDVTVEAFGGKAGRSDLQLSGTFRNLFGWLLTEGQRLDITARATADQIVLDDFISSDQQEDTAAFRFQLPEKLRFTLDLEAGKFAFRKFEATQISGALALESQVLMTRQLDFRSSDGAVRLKGIMDARPADSVRIEYDALVNGVDINKLFYEMGNFGQQVIMDRHLRGRVSAEVQFRSVWSDRLEINDRSIYVKSDLVIENGELLNFDPLLALSRFVKGTDLKNVKFSTLSNTIEIRNRKIDIPMMEIKSTAIDIIASGEHGFDNMVDYRLQLYMSQLLGRKVKDLNTEFGTIEDDGLGRPRLYLTMKGPISDPKFAWDRRGVERKITEEIRTETKTLKQLLKEEFGKKDTTTRQDQPRKKQQELQIDDSDEEE